MDIIYIAAGLFVSFIFVSRRELLIEKESFKLILGASVILFVVGIVLHFTGDAGRYSASGALLGPLPSLAFYRLFRKLFVTWFKHEPRDTFNNWEPGLGEDRIFNIVYGSLSAIITMLAMSSMKSLTDAGW
ncbi:MAG TPA: hypothetical protein VM095_01130 [Pyrinomonadaceae bacterium]|nr:hypothetical protein [Pyrinomonadaceae bacterium]